MNFREFRLTEMKRTVMNDLPVAFPHEVIKPELKDVFSAWSRETILKCQLVNACIGIAGEWHEVCEARTHAEKKDELGDLVWYCALFFNAYEELFGEIKIEKTTDSRQIGFLTMELLEQAKKYVFQRNRKHVPKIDLVYQIVCFISEHYDIEEIIDINVKKLRARYPEGFSQERSENR